MGDKRIGHLGFNGGRITRVETTDGDKLGRIVREPFPLGGYIFTAYDAAGKELYCGNQLPAALAAYKREG